MNKVQKTPTTLATEKKKSFLGRIKNYNTKIRLKESETKVSILPCWYRSDIDTELTSILWINTSTDKFIFDIFFVHSFNIFG